MAKQTGVIKFTGKLGDVTGYRRNKVHLLRQLPEKVNQTAATRQAARKFGVISRQGKLIRRAIVPHLDTRYDGTLVNRLNRALILAGKPHSRTVDTTPATSYTTALASLPPAGLPVTQPAIRDGQTRSSYLQNLQGFRFNPFTGVDNILTQKPVFTKAGVLQLPAQDIRIPKRSTHLEVRAIGVRINFTERRITGMDEALELTPINGSFNGLELPLTVPGKGMLFVVLQVRACVNSDGAIAPLGDRRYMAADIVAVIPQETQRSRKQQGRKHMAYKPLHTVINRPSTIVFVNKPPFKDVTSPPFNPQLE